MKRTLPTTHPVYQTRTRERGWTVPVNIIMTVDGTMLAKRLPGWTREDHEHAAASHAAASKRAARAWEREFHAACMSAFGRPPVFTDYQIAGIGRDEFAPNAKDRLRAAARSRSDHSTLAHAHDAAARIVSRIRYFRPVA